MVTVHGLDIGIHADMTVFSSLSALVYNDEISGLGSLILQSPAISCLAVLREAGASKTPFPSRSLGTSNKEVIFDHILRYFLRIVNFR